MKFMSGKIIDGVAHAAAIRKDLFEMVKLRKEHYANKRHIAIDEKSGNEVFNKQKVNHSLPPHLAVVLVGDDPASLVYIKNKQRACEEIGINFSLHTLPKTATQDDVIKTVDKLNKDETVHGILVQQPFPSHISKHEVVLSVATEKDVDCLHPHNLGLVAMGQAHVLPCTPSGVVNLLKRESINIAGKHAVIVGRSDIVGKPLAFMLLAENATVTICHSRTQNLSEICKQADILVAAIGQPKFITDGHVKEGAVVIDVGINRVNDKLCGDVDFEKIIGKASYITPVPGGVGPMTIATLMQNCVRAWETLNV